MLLVKKIECILRICYKLFVELKPNFQGNALNQNREGNNILCYTVLHYNFFFSIKLPTTHSILSAAICRELNFK